MNKIERISKKNLKSISNKPIKPIKPIKPKADLDILNEDGLINYKEEEPLKTAHTNPIVLIEKGKFIINI